jgi:catechol 2,3-dioxygenase-like lactoylglutathione lyase family enzyme
MNLEPYVSLITLGVEDLGRALAFYRDGLGWPVSGASGEDVAFLRTGGVVLSLYPLDKLAEDARIDPDGTGFRGITLAHNVPERGDVDRAIEMAVAAGARLVKPAEDVFWGGRSGYFADPDGHLWEVAWNPGFPLGPGGYPVLPE